MKSIKTRLFTNFVFVIIITVIIINILLILSVKKYFYKNTEVLLINKAKMSSELYERYFSTSSLKDNIMDNVDFFYQDNSLQVQIYDEKANLIMDSIGVGYVKESQSLDVKKALSGSIKTWVGHVDYADDYVMAVSCPLKSDDKVVGVIRFITSLKNVNRRIIRISFVFFWIGIIVIIISGLVSIKLSNSIIKPIKELTNAAEKMASGDLKIRSIKKYDDEIGKLSDTLNYMAEELLKKENIKNDFISSVSHELRTPLTSIKGWAVTLKTGDLNDKNLIMDGLEIIEKESDRLTEMVEELLSISKFISGKNTLVKEEIDYVSLVKSIEKQLLPKAKFEDIELKVRFNGNIPIIYADEDKLKQVFINILDNSFRFTPKGGRIEIVSICKNDYLYIIIKDNGCGIPMDELPYVKEKFFKGKNSKSKNGLGLSICDEIIKLHGGNIEIKSEVNVGTEVIIKLPIKEDIYENK